MIKLTDELTGDSVYVNKDHVVAVFTINEGEHTGKTTVALINGQILVKEDAADVAKQID